MRQFKNKFLLSAALCFLSACDPRAKNIDTGNNEYAPAPPPPFRFDERPTTLFSNSTADFTCLVNENNLSEIKCWGDNSSGQITGTAASTEYAPITTVTGLPKEDALTMAVGSSHACAVFADNSVWCWGDNSSGQVDSVADRSKLYPSTQVGQAVFPDLNVKFLAAGAAHTCLAFDDEEGSIWCWGENSSGQVSGNGSTTPTSIFTHVNQNVKLPKRAVVALTAGSNFTCAAYENQSVWCWGNNVFGQVNGEANYEKEFSVASFAQKATKVVGLPREDVTNLTAGFDHVCANLNDGNIWCWGNDKNAQVSGIRNTSALTPGLTLVHGIPHDAFAMTAGEHFTCAAFKDGNLWCWGDNQNGAVDGAGYPGSSAQRITKLSAVQNESVVLAAGSKHMCAAFTTGEVWCWGDDSKGQVSGTGVGGVSYEGATQLNLD